jgi:succinylglutamate desuccinylase
MTDVQGWLDRFDAIRAAGPFAYARHHHHDGGRHDLHVVIGAIVHGDEVGSLPAIVGLMEQLLLGGATFGGRLTIFLGNPEAALAGRRFLENDLNRVFVDAPPDDHEGRRATEIRPILDAADVFLDLHQTILETDRPFYIFPWSIPGWQWARAIGGASTWVTRPPTQAFSPGTCCADEYVRLRGRPGITLELGERGFTPEADRRAAHAVRRLLKVADRVGGGTDTLAGAATHEPDLAFVETRWRAAFTDPHLRLRPGLTNFAPVQAGDRLSADGTPELLAPVDGLVLFPKYPDYADDGRVIEPRPGEIVRIVAPLAEHPAVAWEAGG